MNRFLIRYALQNQQTGASQAYVGLSADEVIAFYALVVGQVDCTNAPERLTKGLVRRLVSIMFLARLATALAWQGKGIGSCLLKDAMLRTLQAADIAGIRARAVHAEDEQARAFHERFDLIPSPTDPFIFSSCLRTCARRCRNELSTWTRMPPLHRQIGIEDQTARPADSDQKKSCSAS